MCRKRILIVIVILFLMPLLPSIAAENRYITDWMSSSQFQSAFNRMTDNRFYTHYVEGRTVDGAIQYRGEFRPIFKNLKHWYSYYGMSDEIYVKRKAAFEAKGFQEIYHTSFLDLGGLRVHQSCWIELADPAEGLPQIKQEHQFNGRLGQVAQSAGGGGR